MAKQAARVILHGKQSANQAFREAVATLRKDEFEVDVRVTWEAGNAGFLATEAAHAGIGRIVAGGGDGTVNEVLNGVLQSGVDCSLGILPLGTANDFARSLGIPLEMEPALRLAVTGETWPVDVGYLDDRAFINVATGGFGTEVTVRTNPKLKKALGGAAYLLTGLTRFSSVKAVPCKLTAPEASWEGRLVALGIGNGRQAGGGHILCPEASINDGLLDVAILPEVKDVPALEAIDALMTRGIAAIEDVVVRWRVPWVEVEAPDGMHLNLDGEPESGTKHRLTIAPGRINLILPGDCPLLSR